MLSQDEANELLAAFDSGEFSGRIEQAIVDNEDSDAVLEQLYERFVEQRQETLDEEAGDGVAEWAQLQRQGVTPEHVRTWLQQLWDDLQNELD